MEYDEFEKNLELYHFGIKGQKWGIRKYQYEDGSLTPAGVKRYGTAENLQKEMAEKQAKKEANKEKAKKVAKGVAIGAGVAVAVGAGLTAASMAKKIDPKDVERLSMKGKVKVAKALHMHGSQKMSRLTAAQQSTLAQRKLLRQQMNSSTGADRIKAEQRLDKTYLHGRNYLGNYRATHQRHY